MKQQEKHLCYDCISYVSVWTAAPCSCRCPAAGLSVFAAGLIVTLDFADTGLWMMLRQKHRCQWETLQLQHDDLLTGVGGDVTGVTLRAAVLLIWAAHSLQTQHGG